MDYFCPSPDKLSRPVLKVPKATTSRDNRQNYKLNSQASFGPRVKFEEQENRHQIEMKKRLRRKSIQKIRDQFSKKGAVRSGGDGYEQNTFQSYGDPSGHQQVYIRIPQTTTEKQ